jgi:hypothetical protein
MKLPWIVNQGPVNLNLSGTRKRPSIAYSSCADPSPFEAPSPLAALLCQNQRPPLSFCGTVLDWDRIYIHCRIVKTNAIKPIAAVKIPMATPAHSAFEILSPLFGPDGGLEGDVEFAVGFDIVVAGVIGGVEVSRNIVSKLLLQHELARIPT